MIWSDESISNKTKFMQFSRANDNDYNNIECWLGRRIQIGCLVMGLDEKCTFEY